MSALTDGLLAMSEDRRRAALSGLTADELLALEYDWPVWARSDQLTPRTAFRTWLMLGGRGSGKTRSAAEATRAEVESGRRASVGLVGPTADTLRRDQVAAILRVSPPWCMPIHEPSQRRLVWPNGAVAHCLSSEEPDRIRGLNLDWVWGDELTSWANQADVWSNTQLALRVPGPKGDAPAAVISTTPKRQKLIRAILAMPSTVTTRSKTFDNAANLDASTIEHLKTMYAGTTLGRQELDAEILNDAEDALWNRDMLDSSRVTQAPDDLKRVVVAIDPAGSSNRGGAETGIVVVGKAANGHCYVLRDGSGKFTPRNWARRAIDLFIATKADRIIAETNYGGEMVEATIRSVGSRAPVKKVTATRGKAVRAEPVVALYEQGMVHHVGNFPELEDQLCEWCPMESGPSPDRLDALVWALTDLSALGPAPTTVKRLLY